MADPAPQRAERARRALDKVVVLDLGQVYNGPYCSMLLQELGADVVKIEPLGGEPIRWRSDGTDGNAAYQLINAGKRAVTIDLKHPEGNALFLRMVELADVVIENFAPGVMDRLGLSYKEIREVNPRIIFASGKGYGSSGPNREFRGMDVTVQAMTGIIATTGFPDGPPVKAGPAVVDFTAGAHLAAAILAALYQREKTGIGQYVEVAMQDAILPTLASNIGGYIERGETFPDRVGNRQGGLNVTPYNVYETKDGHIAILCIRQRHWFAVCDLMDRPDLAGDEELAQPQGRVDRMNEIDEAVTAWTRRQCKDTLFALLQAADVPCAPVRTLHEVMTDDHIRERGMLRSLSKGARSCLVLGSPLRLADSAPTVPSFPPELGEHTDEVLTGLLGLDSDEIVRLKKEKII